MSLPRTRVTRITHNRARTAIMIRTHSPQPLEPGGHYGYILPGDPSPSEVIAFVQELSAQHGRRLHRRPSHLSDISALREGVLVDLSLGGPSARLVFDGLGYAERAALQAHARHPELALAHLIRERARTRRERDQASERRRDQIQADIRNRVAPARQGDSRAVF